MIFKALHLGLLLNRVTWIAYLAAIEADEERKRAVREELYRLELDAREAGRRIREAFDRSRPTDEIVDEQTAFRDFVDRKTRGKRKRKRGGKRSRRRAVTIPGTGRTVLTRRTDPDSIKARGR
jgi:hypothetical protein